MSKMEGKEKEHPEDANADSSGLSRLVDDCMTLTKARLSMMVVVTTAFGYLIAAKAFGGFSWLLFFHILFGTVLTAFGASVYNQLMEVESDAKMTRTADRPLPSERIPKPAAFVIGWVLCAFGIIHLGMMVNASAAFLAAGTLVTYLFIYTPMKRKSSFNTILGAVSGALPPLIGWAGGGGELLTWGASYLFGLLFFWQLPHFVAINWMYREEYEKGGFIMWSNNDESGQKSAMLATVFSVCVLVFGVGMIFSGIMAMWSVIGQFILGTVMLSLALKFRRTRERKDARTLFFYTLLYLPLAMGLAYIAWQN